MSDMKKCDHCGATIDVSEEKPASRSGWAVVEITQSKGGKSYDWESDLCPKCVTGVHVICGNEDAPKW